MDEHCLLDIGFSDLMAGEFLTLKYILMCQNSFELFISDDHLQ